jgi:cysteinyl-tRNA synthetase
MSETHLGQTFDIHGGGQDLIFPHHENEIAQSVCAHGGAEFVRYWMHNGYLTVDGEKMSKSLGNFYTVRDLLEQTPGEAIRLALLSAHYRQPLDFSQRALQEAKVQLDRFYGALKRAADIDAVKPPRAEQRNEGFWDALCDDLNTPLAIKHLHGRMGQLNLDLSTGAKIAQSESKWLLLEMGNVLGLLQHDPENWIKGGAAVAGRKHTNFTIAVLLVARNEARKNKDFAEADRIRDELAKDGIVLEDKPDGTTDWRRT